MCTVNIIGHISQVPNEPFDGFSSGITAGLMGMDREIKNILAMPIMTENRKVLGMEMFQQLSKHVQKCNELRYSPGKKGWLPY